MLLTDYFLSAPDETWQLARACGVTHGTIRLPDEPFFDVTSKPQLKNVIQRFRTGGIEPVVLEPLPNSLHDHIKAGDSLRDASIEKFILLMKNLQGTGITTVCFNFMAHYGWTRTDTRIPERGDCFVTGFSEQAFHNDGTHITAEQLWENYRYFLRAVLPYAEQYGVRLALHPDDPPLAQLGGVARIFTSLTNIRRGVSEIPSPNLGVTFCQACYYLMGEQLETAIDALADKIFFIHFRNVAGEKSCFRETFHDNGAIDMAAVMKRYLSHGIDVPIRVDHVPAFGAECAANTGYNTLGRLFAIGYLKGILDGLKAESGSGQAL